MKKLVPALRDDRGAAVIEIAIALPVLVLFVWGIFQIGIAFQASAGMQHALGEGARLATICLNPTADGVCSTATDEQIEDLVNEKLYGTGVGDFLQAMPPPGSGEDLPVWRLLRALARNQVPLVAAVHGNAVGIGTTMLFHCDFVLAEEGCRFVMPFVDLGLVPEAASSLLFPRLAGRRRAATR